MITLFSFITFLKNTSIHSVLAQIGGTGIYRSHSIPFISLGKLDYILLDSINAVLQPTAKGLSTLRRRAVAGQPHEIDFLRLVQFYQRNEQQDDRIVLNQSQPQLLISISEVQKYVEQNGIIIDMSLTQYQQNEYRKLKKQLESLDKQPMRKPTKRKATSIIMEHHRSIDER